ncbi:MAG TPA: hypothetical protein VFK48_00205 [Usitatibacter sp.]|nr:hypothetical protein [Usitatibacter sp.]
MPLDFVVPGLLLPPGAPEGLRASRQPVVERWLARADVTRLPHRGLHAALASSFDLPSPPPVAAITLAADNAVHPGTWLRADPVHLRLGQATGTMHDTAALEVTASEANALVAALQAHFAEDGLEFVAPVPSRWYVRVPEGEAPATVPLDEALDGDPFSLLPRGTGRINWPGVVTEAQMVLSAHAVNREREARRLPAINSVWLWGEGSAPQVRSPYALVYSDDPFARGLGRIAGVRSMELPPGFAGVDAVPDAESVLVVVASLEEALRRGDAEAWGRELERIAQAWFAASDAALHTFGRVNLVMPGAGGTVVASRTPGFRWKRLFRSARPLSAYA